jgi:hypothetical protein
LARLPPALRCARGSARLAAGVALAGGLSRERFALVNAFRRSHARISLPADQTVAECFADAPPPRQAWSPFARALNAAFARLARVQRLARRSAGAAASIS